MLTTGGKPPVITRFISAAISCGSGCSYTSGVASGTTIGTMSAVITPPNMFTGSWGTSGTAAADFTPSGNQLQTNSSTPTCTSTTSLSLNIVATQAGVAGSPYPTAITVTCNPTGGGSIACAIGPNVASIPAPANSAGFTTCVANWDFGSTGNFTYNGATYNFSQPLSSGGITGWLGCSFSQANALWWTTGWNSSGIPACSDFNIINDGGNVLSMIYTTTDFNNNASATWLGLGPGGFGGQPYNFATYTFPQNVFIDYQFEMLPANVNPYTCPVNEYCELMDFFAIQASSSTFMELDFLEMDSVAGGRAYSCGTNCTNGFNDYGGAARFVYTEYGTLLTSDGTQSYMCGYLNGAGKNCGYATTYTDDRVSWGFGVGPQPGFVAPNSGVTPEMRIRYMRVFSCANWGSTGPDVCNRSVITSPP
jgi:hypothetical protein